MRRLQLDTADQERVRKAAGVSAATLRRWLHGVNGLVAVDRAIEAAVAELGLVVDRPGAPRPALTLVQPH